MSKSPLEWDESDLTKLIGESEDYKLEFKGVEIFFDRTGRPQNNENIARNLTKEVSAFANADGGVIIIGLSEDTSKPAKANNLDGVDDTIMDIERLQRIVEHNMSPHLPGMRFRAIPLAGTAPVRNAFLIIVPKGSNAYQSKERIYYIRSEFECTALHDTQIRLLMSRGKTMQAEMVLNNKHTQIAEKDYQQTISHIPKRIEAQYQGNNSPSIKNRIKSQIVEETSKIQKNKYDEYNFSLALKNVGELTILECYLTIEFVFIKATERIPGKPIPHALIHQGQTKSGFKSANYMYSSKENSFEAEKKGKFEAEKKVYPGISVRFPHAGYIVNIPEGKTLAEFGSKLKWTLYYDNFPSNSGEINLSDEFKGI